MNTGHELAMALRLAYLAMHRQADAALADHGVTADQFVVLAALAQADALTQQDLARRICSDANTLGAMLLLLEGRGLVARGPHPSDGRARSVTLTKQGQQAYEKIWADSEPFRERLLDAVGPEQVATLLALLGRVAQAMTPPPAADGRRTRRSAAPPDGEQDEID